MKYEVHIPGGLPYFSFVVEYDPSDPNEVVPDKTLTVIEALEWAQVVKDALGIQDTGSHMADAAQVMGAQVVPSQPQRAQPYQPPQQQNVNQQVAARAYTPPQTQVASTSVGAPTYNEGDIVQQGIVQGWVCKGCEGPIAFRPGTKVGRNRFQPFNLQAPADCVSGCRNPKNPQYALGTFVNLEA